MKYSTQKGFTVTEILVSAGIMVVILTVVIGGFSLFRKRSDLRATGELGISILEQARSQTLGAKASSQYGVHFETDRFTQFTGATYDSMSSDNVHHILPGTVQLGSITLNGGGSDIVFERLIGETSQHGTIRIELVSDPLVFFIIKVDATGIAYQQ